MQWVKKEADYRVPIKSWCGDMEAEALGQAVDLACHPVKDETVYNRHAKGAS